MIQPDFIVKDAIALVDSGADMNCIQEGLVPINYFQKTSQSLTSASGNSLSRASFTSWYATCSLASEVEATRYYFCIFINIES